PSLAVGVCGALRHRLPLARLRNRGPESRHRGIPEPGAPLRRPPRYVLTVAETAAETSPGVRTWTPAGLLIRVASGLVIGLAALGLLLVGLWGVAAIVAVAGGLALWEFRGLS